MSDRLEQFREDRELRDAARAVLMADIRHVRESFSGKGMATRIADRIGEGAVDVFEAAKTQADDKRGIIAVLLGAIILWITRNPILEILGLNEADHDEIEADQQRSDHEMETGEEIEAPQDEPEGEENDDNAHH